MGLSHSTPWSTTSGRTRREKTNRVRAVVTELQRLGIEVTEEDDGFLIRPGRPTAAEVQTYDDPRMAMSFALIFCTGRGGMVRCTR